MVARQQEVLDKLRSGDRSIRLKAVRDIKNQIIGNKSKKLSYIKLQAVPEVVALLQDCADAHLLVQSAAAVGSFAYGVEAGRQAVLASGGVKYLLHAVSSQDDSVVEAGLRALKLVWQSSQAVQAGQLECSALEPLVRVLSASNSRTSLMAAQVVAEYCQCAQKDVLSRLSQEPSIVPGLLQLLSPQHTAGKEAAVASLALLTAHSPDMARQCSLHSQWQHWLLGLLKHDQPAIRLAACVCLQNICSHQSKIVDSNSLEMVQRAMLPVLLKLLHLPTVLEAVPQVLTSLLQGSPAMQQAANDSDAVSSLTTLLQHQQTWQDRPRFKGGVLKALAILCEHSPAARAKFVERASIGQLAQGLESSDLEVCSAALDCVKSVTCNMKCLWDIDMDELTPAVVRLLGHPQPGIRRTALKTLSNLLLDTEHVKATVSQSGGLQALTQLVGEAEAEARCSGVWALANMVYMASPAVTQAVLHALPWGRFQPLLHDSSPNVQEKAFYFMRNLFSKSRDATHEIKLWSHEAVVPAVLDILEKASHLQHATLVHALYSLSNFAAKGSEQDRDGLASMVGPCINLQLHHESLGVRTAALWVLVNLTDGVEDETGGAVRRVEQFQSIGMEAKVRELLQDMSLEVRERAMTAMNNFKSGRQG